MRTATLATVAIVLVAVLGGCNPTVERPDIFHPGPLLSQKQRAIQYDPYPDQDMGPRVEGGRPLDYDQQIPEVERSRFFLPSGGPVGVRNPGNWFGKRTGSPTPMPTTVPVVPPPGTTSQVAPAPF
jgi:hypothetical protein